MIFLKTPETEKPIIRNVDLLKTYYSGNKTPVKDKRTLSLLKRMFSRKLILSTAILIVVITGAVIIGYSLSVKDASKVKLIATSKGTPSNPTSNTSYYNYEQIRDSSASIALGEENSFAVITLRSAMDLTNATISFGARGETGEEKVALILRDVKKMSNANPDDIILTTPLTGNKWHFFKVDLKKLKIPIDKSKITQIRFDNSYRLTKNQPEARVYIKNIVIEQAGKENLR